MAKKRIKAFGEWVEDLLRRACGALSPDKRIIVILTLLLFFSVLSLYFTVSSIYRFGKGAGAPTARIIFAPSGRNSVRHDLHFGKELVYCRIG